MSIGSAGLDEQQAEIENIIRTAFKISFSEQEALTKASVTLLANGYVKQRRRSGVGLRACGHTYPAAEQTGAEPCPKCALIAALKD